MRYYIIVYAFMHGLDFDSCMNQLRLEWENSNGNTINIFDLEIHSQDLKTMLIKPNALFNMIKNAKSNNVSLIIIDNNIYYYYYKNKIETISSQLDTEFVSTFLYEETKHGVFDGYKIFKDFGKKFIGYTSNKNIIYF